MDFYTELCQKTLPDKKSLYEAPVIQYCFAGQVILESYIAFLTQAYHHVKHTVPLLMYCGSKLSSDKEWFREKLAHYIEEELGHQEWILNDGYEGRESTNGTWLYLNEDCELEEGMVFKSN